MRRTSEVSQKSDFSADVVPCNGVEERREKIKNWQSLFLQALWPDEVRTKIFRQWQDVQKKRWILLRICFLRTAVDAGGSAMWQLVAVTRDERLKICRSQTAWLLEKGGVSGWMKEGIDKKIHSISNKLQHHYSIPNSLMHILDYQLKCRFSFRETEITYLRKHASSKPQLSHLFHNINRHVFNPYLFFDLMTFH